MAKSLFQQQMNGVEEQKTAMANSVSNEAVQATPEERKVVHDIVEYVSREFADRIAIEGENDSIQRDIRKRIGEEVEKLDDSRYDFQTRRRIEKLAVEMTGLGPLEPLLADPDITEIVVQRYDHIVVEKKGKIIDVPARFEDEEHLVTIINKIVQSKGRQVNLMTPIVDSRLDDGSRVNAVIPPIMADGASITIRKFFKEKLTYKDYLRFGSIDQKMLNFIEQCVIGKCNIFISGGTGTGKTTFLNMLSNYVPKDELIITIEDTCELQIQSPNVRRMETRPIQSDKMMYVDTAACVKSALRMRPDRIIVGEVRDGSIVDLLSALSTGHDGGLATGHANSPENMVHVRLPIMYGMNEQMKVTTEAQQLQFAEAFDLIIQLKRFIDGKRRITEISEICGTDGDGYCKIVPIFKYDEINDKFMTTGHVPEKALLKCEGNKVVIDRDMFREGEDEEVEPFSRVDEKTDDGSPSAPVPQTPQQGARPHGGMPQAPQNMHHAPQGMNGVPQGMKGMPQNQGARPAPQGMGQGMRQNAPYPQQWGMQYPPNGQGYQHPQQAQWNGRPAGGMPGMNNPPPAQAGTDGRQPAPQVRQTSPTEGRQGEQAVNPAPAADNAAGDDDAASRMASEIMASIGDINLDVNRRRVGNPKNQPVDMDMGGVSIRF